MISELIERKLAEVNKINKDEAITEDMVGLEIYDKPLIAYGNSNDPLFKELEENNDIVYGKFLGPAYWIDKPRTVVSVFFPYTKVIKESNCKEKSVPSSEWLHGRYEGQKIINKICEYVIDEVRKSGFNIACPTVDDRFKSVNGISNEEKQETLSNSDYYSNWSERHVAYICGLGTFGLSKGIITEKGMAGRFASFIVDIDYQITDRKYTDIYEYCSNCGACIGKCPVKAISKDNGKLHTPCSRLLDHIKKINKPRYGCGKCQVGVPCESARP